jgi:mannose-6-phosphate isomerase-like protein (cupin superfamily)
MKTVLCALGLFCGLSVSGGIAAQTPSNAGAAAVAPVITPTNEIKWVQVRPGQETSVLWGDPRTGPYGRLNRFADGFEDRLHYHTRDLRAVVVSGALVVQAMGGERRELGPGSYVLLPGRTPHTHSCKAGAACVLFVEQEGPNDTVPVESAR